jgi:transcriptional regulator with XRE-family HTH domain
MNLHEYMKNNDINDQKLADKVGVSRSAITQYRLGDRMPKPEILVKLVAATDNEVSPLDLASGLRRGK